MAGKSLIGALRVFLGLDTAQFTEGAEKAKDSIKEFVEKTKKALEALAAAFAVEKLIEGFAKISENLDALGKAAQKIGIPVAQLAELKYAAELAYVPIENLQSSIGKFSKGLSEFAATGKGTVGEALRTIGVAATDANGKLKPQKQLIEEIAEKFSGYTDGANKTALAIALFGKAGAELIPLLNEGKRGIKEAGDQLLSFGGVPTEQAVKAAQTLNDNFKRIKEAMYAVAQQVVILVTPAVRNMTNAIVDFLGKGGGAKAAANIIIRAMEGIALATIGVGNELAASTSTIREWIGSVDSLLARYDAINNAYKDFQYSSGRAVYDFGVQVRYALGIAQQASNLAGKGDSGLKALGDGFQSTGNDALDAAAKVKAFFDQVLNRKGDPFDANGEEPKKKTKDAPAFAAGAIDAADKLKDKIRDVIKALQIQNEGFSKSALQMRIDEELRRAGTTAATAQGHAIEQLVILNEKYRVAQQTQMQEAQNELDRLSKTAELVKGVFQSWFDSALDGTFNLANAFADLAKSLAKTGLSNILNNLFSVGVGNQMQGESGSGLLSGLGKLLGFATGGTILPGGSGGVDSQLVAFRKSPDERVDITRPGQRLTSGGGTVVNMSIDARGADAGRIAAMENKLTGIIKSLPKVVLGSVTHEKGNNPGFAT